MKVKVFSIIAVVAFGMLVSSETVVAADGEAAGPIIARYCAVCHLVPNINKGARWSPMAGAPPFQQIADDRQTYSRARLSSFLSQPHFPMKSIILSKSDIEKLLAYFASLRTDSSRHHR